jgi:hypothetical protein
LENPASPSHEEKDSHPEKSDARQPEVARLAQWPV